MWTQLTDHTEYNANYIQNQIRNKFNKFKRIG